jgi:hypothetical protein
MSKKCFLILVSIVGCDAFSAYSLNQQNTFGRAMEQPVQAEKQKTETETAGSTPATTESVKVDVGAGKEDVTLAAENRLDNDEKQVEKHDARRMKSVRGDAVPAKVWAVDGMRRVELGEAPPAILSQTAELYAAKGEYEPFQIVIQAVSQAVKCTGVVVGDLVGPGGTVIPKSSVTLYREQYIHVLGSSPTPWQEEPPWRGGKDRVSNYPMGKGVYADALIPFVDPSNGQKPNHARLVAVPFTLLPGRNQPIWVDVFVPRDTRSGTYEGVCEIVFGHGARETVKIALVVWDFELPLRPSLRSFIAGPSKVLLDHKIMGSGAPEKVNAVFTRFWTGCDAANPRIDKVPEPDVFLDAQKKYAQDLWPYLIAYTADEISGHPELYEQIKKLGRHMHAQSVIKNLIVMVPTPELFDDGTGHPAVDIWPVLPFQSAKDSHGPNHIQAAKNLGCEIWSYTALSQDRYSPKWLMDYAPINFRIMPWVNHSLGYSGLLYWSSIKWGKEDVPWYSIKGLKNTWLGEGQLVYPGAEVGVEEETPSMRLKWIRKSVEDYEYVELLKKAGEGDFAMRLVKEVAPDWEAWTRDPQVIHDARGRMGRRLHELRTKRLLEAKE